MNSIPLKGGGFLGGSADGGKQVGFIHGFSEKVHCPFLHRLGTTADVAAASEENDRKRPTALRESVREIESCQFGHREIQQEAARSSRVIRLEKVEGEANAEMPAEARRRSVTASTSESSSTKQTAGDCMQSGSGVDG